MHLTHLDIRRRHVRVYLDGRDITARALEFDTSQGWVDVLVHLPGGRTTEERKTGDLTTRPSPEELESHHATIEGWQSKPRKHVHEHGRNKELMEKERREREAANG